MSVYKLLKKDIRLIFKNFRTVIIFIGLILLPSAYAWPNILASWDPYGHTSGLKVAVTSLDKGSIIKENNINLGYKLIENLKENKNLDWQFINNRKDAEEGVKKGDYYASIVIPEDFSEKISSVTRGEPQTANIEYTVNEKINAISPKVTDKGASSVVTSIDKNFVETANGVIFEKLHEIGLDAEENSIKLKKLRDFLFSVNDNFDNYQENLYTIINKVEIGQDLIEKSYNIIPKIDNATTKTIEFAEKSDIINKVDAFNKKLLPDINSHIEFIETSAEFLNDVVEFMNKKPTNKEEIKSRLKNLNTKLDIAENHLAEIEEIAKYLNNFSHNNYLDSFLLKINKLQYNIKDLKNKANYILENIDNLAEIKEDFYKQFNEIVPIFNNNLSNLHDYINEDVAPRIDTIIKKANEDLDLALPIILNYQKKLHYLVDDLYKLDSKMNNIHSKLLILNNDMPDIKESLIKITDKIKNSEDKFNTEDALKLLHTDYNKQASFFASPVELKENKLYHIENYGSAMTPFYTILSIWVGALLMSSLLSTKASYLGGEYKNYQVYLAKGILFIIISLLQTTVISLGNIFLLGTQTPVKWTFFLFSLIVSVTFCIIVYTIVSIFGNVGKAICIIILVLQMGSSGSTFPIQMTSEFFQFLYPKVPFTYAVSLMREAVGGVYWTSATRDILHLLLYFVISLLLGLIINILKDILNKTDKIEDKSPLFL